MIRWMRFVAIAVLLLALVVVGAGVGLLLVRNSSSWVVIELHPWLQVIFGRSKEVWLPALLAGWLVAVLAVGALLLWSMLYVWRRRQYESLVSRLERELIALRNLPFTAPAPFADDGDHEPPDPRAADILSVIEQQSPAVDGPDALEHASGRSGGSPGEQQGGRP